MEILRKDHYYHIFNRGINGCRIFKSDDNKVHFLKLVGKYLDNKVDIMAYCLMDNHFHFIVKVTTETNLVSKAFSNLFNAYAKAFNKQESRSGALFERPFKRKRITSEEYLKNLIVYVHTNPENHGIIANFMDYQFSSFRELINGHTMKLPLKSEQTIALFDTIENMIYTHNNKKGKDFEAIHNPDLTGFKNLSGPSIKDKFFEYIHQLQDTITHALESIDGKAKFHEDNWERPEGGGGRTRVIENGDVFEKGGVNISGVHGELPKSMQAYFGVQEADFFACGLSLVLHPKNPMVPTVHANWRYFEMYDKDGQIVDQWFGGGQDLTPYYVFEEDAEHFHKVCKAACDRHDPSFYPTYKKKCDEYFWNSHRHEARGIGGLFFDYCKKTENSSMEDWYNFVTEVGNSFLDGYIPIVTKRKDLPYTQEQRDWQEIRRGRYVEFNLVHDKGTLFGLRTNGRIESILMSLPSHVQWRYDHQPEAGSEEEKLINVLKQPRDWVS